MTMCARTMKERWPAVCRLAIPRGGKGLSDALAVRANALSATGNAVRVAGLRRVSTALAALIVAIPTAMAAGAAPAQIVPRTETFAQCAPADAVLAELRGRYHEEPFWIGYTDGGSNTVVLTRRRDGGSWTLLAIGESPDGVAIACMVAAGVSADPVVPTQ